MSNNDQLIDQIKRQANVLRALYDDVREIDDHAGWASQVKLLESVFWALSVLGDDSGIDWIEPAH